MKKTIFEVKEEHLKLLKNMNVEWNGGEYGAPAIDPRRPYGNNDVLQDMAVTLGLKRFRGNVFKIELFGKEYFVVEDEMEEDLEEVLSNLHRETETVLQIALNTGRFKAGKYELVDEYGTDWKMVE
jgi:hypothetical protein